MIRGASSDQSRPRFYKGIRTDYANPDLFHKETKLKLYTNNSQDFNTSKLEFWSFNSFKDDLTFVGTKGAGLGTFGPGPVLLSSFSNWNSIRPARSNIHGRYDTLEDILAANIPSVVANGNGIPLNIPYLPNINPGNTTVDGITASDSLVWEGVQGGATSALFRPDPAFLRAYSQPHLRDGTHEITGITNEFNRFGTMTTSNENQVLTSAIVPYWQSFYISTVKLRVKGRVSITGVSAETQNANSTPIGSPWVNYHALPISNVLRVGCNVIPVGNPGDVFTSGNRNHYTVNPPQSEYWKTPLNYDTIWGMDAAATPITGKPSIGMQRSRYLTYKDVNLDLVAKTGVSTEFSLDLEVVPHQWLQMEGDDMKYESMASLLGSTYGFYNDFNVGGHVTNGSYPYNMAYMAGLTQGHASGTPGTQLLKNQVNYLREFSNNELFFRISGGLLYEVPVGMTVQVELDVERRSKVHMFTNRKPATKPTSVGGIVAFQAFDVNELPPTY